MIMGPTKISYVVACILVGIVVLVTFVSGQEPTITVSEDQIKEIGEEAVFNCTVENLAPEWSIVWMMYGKDNRGDPTPVVLNDRLVLTDNRMTLVSSNESSTYTASIKIKDLQESDTGFYSCRALKKANEKVSADIELQIRRPAAIKSTAVFANVTEGALVELKCEADGYPVPQITWKRHDDLLFPSGGAIYRGNVMRIDNVHRDDRGVYYCTATNGVGPVATYNITLVVGFAPNVMAVRPRVGQTIGEAIDLECQIEAHPAPNVTWFKDNVELKKEKSHSQKDVFVDTLKRYSVTQSDFGIYVCRAENSLGKSEAKIELFEAGVPKCYESSCR